MHWIIQTNVAREERHDAFVEAVRRVGDTFTMVKHIPFTLNITPQPTINEAIVIGSVTLTQKIGPKRGWTTFTNDNFDYNVWAEKWKGFIMNDDAVVAPFRDVPMDREIFFIRPTKDNKAFTGMIMDRTEYGQWLNRLLAGEQASDLDFDLDEEVLVATPKKILKEVRFFVVDDKVASHSTYRIGNQTRYLDDTMTDTDAVDFVNRMLKMWTPDKAFVLDVALVENDDETQAWEIIEINCLNCAGFYKADVDKIVRALHELMSGSLSASLSG